MPLTTYFTATTLDGFIADEHDSLDWLLEQETDEGGPAGYEEFIAGIGAMVMGRTTYEWVGAHMERTGEPWAYDIPCFVFTHAALEPLGDDVHLVSGPVAEHHARIAEAAGDRGIWVVGGGDLAGQLADLGLLDRMVIAIAPVTLGAGRPLFPRRFDLRLVSQDRNGGFVMATYDVVGPRTD